MLCALGCPLTRMSPRMRPCVLRPSTTSISVVLPAGRGRGKQQQRQAGMATPIERRCARSAGTQQVNMISTQGRAFAGAVDASHHATSQTQTHQQAPPPASLPCPTCARASHEGHEAAGLSIEAYSFEELKLAHNFLVAAGSGIALHDRGGLAPSGVVYVVPVQRRWGSTRSK